MKKTFKRIVASLLVAVMLFGSTPIETLTGLDFGSLFGIEAEAAGYEFQYPVRQQASNTQWYRPKIHEAVDLSLPTDTDVYSIGNGTVVIVYDGCKNYNGYKSGVTCWEKGCPSSQICGSGYCNNSYGNGVVVNHNGKFSHYAHLSEVYVKNGDSVTANTVLGKVGSSGKSEAPHLHFALAKGKEYNAETYDPFAEQSGCFLPWLSIKLTQNDSVLAPKITGEFISKNNAVSGCGIEFGTSANNLSKKASDKEGSYSRHFYTLTNNFGSLEKGKTYYFRLWLEKSRDGHKLKYYSPVYKFEAGEGDITFVDYTRITDVNSNVGDNNEKLTYKLKEKVYDQYISIDSGFYIKDIPYEVGNKIGGKISKGEYFKVVGVYENDLYKNKWYKVIYNGVEGFVFYEHLTKVKSLSKLQYVPNYPKGNLNLRVHKKGESFEIKGSIKSNALNIISAKAEIIKINSLIPLKTSIACSSGELNSNSTVFDLKKFDAAMKFKSLNIGAYAFMVYAKLEGSKNSTLINCEFFSVVPSNFTIEQIKQTVVNRVGYSKLTNADIDGVLAMSDVDFEPQIVISPKVEPDKPNDNEQVKYYNYNLGHYRTTTSDNLNIRTGPGTSYSKATSAIPKGTEIGITEVSSNGWGKTVYNGVTGWVSLNCCTYLGAFAAIQKPGTVTVKYNSDKDFAAGSVVNVSWNAINHADAYNVYLKKSDGTTVKTQTGVKGTSTYFTVDEEGTYYITVAATNSQYVGNESAPTATFNAHGYCYVTFVDWNGREEIRKVKYGESATAPIPPTREGYTFLGWKQPFDHVTSDLTVEANYKINSYNVKFVKVDPSSGKTTVLYSDRFDYGTSVTPPTDTQDPDFYSFVAWDSDDYKFVKKNLTVKAVYQWANADLPVGITNASATRINDGYNIEFMVTTTNESVTSGRIIASLKTESGKQIVTTESAAFSLASATDGKEMEIFIPIDKMASIAEIYVVDSFGKAIPISEVSRCSVVLNNTWSEWTTDKWADNLYDDVDERVVYRYKTKSTTTSSTKNMPGWTLYYTATSQNTGTTYDAIGAVNTDAHTRTVWTESEPIYSTWYRYMHYTNGGYNASTGKSATWACAPWHGNTDDKCGPTNIGPHYYESPTRLTGQASYWKDQLKYNVSCGAWVDSPTNSCKCKNTWFYRETPFQKQTGSRTKYHYTNTYYTYYFEKWSDWSAWTETPHYGSETKTVESRIEYRYKNDSLPEDNEGVVRVASTVSAGLTENDILLPNLKDYAGNAVILYIYKYGEASDWTGEFIGQQTIDADGNYSFNFKLREEPSAETGDYYVSIGIEGCNDTITVGKIIAPRPEYKVVFKYSDPSDNENELITLSEQVIREGDAAQAPEHVEFEGYRFNGWLTDLSYITEDTMFVEYGSESGEKIITFLADYEPEEYVVVFVDWDNDSLVMKRYNYGDNIVAPIIKTEEGHQALWEGLDMENPVVTGDTVITAKHTKKTYEVNFYNYDGEIIDTQVVEYGSTAADVEIGEKDNYIFVDWEYTEDLFENSITEGDIIYAGEPVVNFYPVYVFDESVEDPVSSLENGTYSEEQTVELTTATEGAVIYYTLDGTDPKTAVNDIDQAEKVFEYTGPITLNRSVTLKYYACAFEKNDSEVITNYYTINAGHTESDWMLYEDLPEYVTENEDEYEIESAEGYRYKETITSSNYTDIANYEAQGWENLGFEYGEWSDWFMAEPNLNGMSYESETMAPEPELEVRYQYTRYKYLNESGVYAYSNTQVNGVECELETIQLETKLPTAGYISGTTTKYYTFNGERWFNYELVEVEVVPDYQMFRYRLKLYTLKKWGAWTTEAPVAGETRENESATVYKYSIPEMCLVKIVPDYSDFGADIQYYMVEKNDYFIIDEADYNYEGYDFLGFYTDIEFTKYFNYKTTPISGETTLYPKYKAHEFAVIFVDYDGTVILENTVEYGQCANAFEFEGLDRDGYVFIGWDYEGLDFVTEDIIATAQYVKEEDYCTVTLNYGKYNMMAGNSFQLVATVTPEDTENPNLIWYSTDESVAIVNDEGFVTAVGEGQASIVVETESTGMIDECVINVSANPSESLCLNYSSTLTLDKENELLRGLKNSVWTVSLLKEEFMNEQEEMQVVDINGNTLADGAFVGTGSVLKFMNGEKVVDEVYIVVTGDMNGDGKVNNRDAAMITRYLVEKETADFCQMVAIDVNGDGFVNNRDASMVSRYLVGKEKL